MAGFIDNAEDSTALWRGSCGTICPFAIAHRIPRKAVYSTHRSSCDGPLVVSVDAVLSPLGPPAPEVRRLDEERAASADQELARRHQAARGRVQGAEFMVSCRAAVQALCRAAGVLAELDTTQALD